MMRRCLYALPALILLGCASAEPAPFMPRSDYPVDPWVKGYAEQDDCLGGEKLAAINIALPKYPKRAFKGGRQGWTIVQLDVDAAGKTQNVTVQRAVPAGGMFASPSQKAVKNWRFEAPKGGPLRACRVLIRYRMGAVSLGG